MAPREPRSNLLFIIPHTPQGPGEAIKRAAALGDAMLLSEPGSAQGGGGARRGRESCPEIWPESIAGESRASARLSWLLEEVCLELTSQITAAEIPELVQR